MLDSLLKLSKKDRKKILKGLELETKKHIFNSIYTMTEELGLDEIDDFETRVKMRHELIQQFPDTVFWDYVEYANVKSALKKNKVKDFERSLTCKVSTNGEVVILSTLNPKYIRLYIHTSEISHKYGSIRINNKSIVQHRAIASTFIPKPEKFKDIEYKNLQVNHIDHTRYNSAINNLEWVTQEINLRHALKIKNYDKEKFFLFRVIVDNGFKGRKFILSENDLHLVKTNFSELRKKIKENKNQIYMGFVISLIDIENAEDIFIGPPEDIFSLFNKNSNYFNTNITPIIAKVINGEYKGLEFSLFGKDDIEERFNISNINGIIRKELKTHRECTFRRATHKEAIPLHGKLTDEIFMSLYRGVEKHFLFEVIVDNGFLGRKFIINENNIPVMFIRDAIYNSAKSGGSKRYRGFKVDLLTENDDIKQYEQGFPEDIKELFTINENYFDYKLTPIIVTLLEGELKGLEFSLFGSHERYSLFGHRALKDLYEGKYRHLFRCNIRPATHKKAIPLHTEVTEEIFDYINNYKYGK